MTDSVSSEIASIDTLLVVDAYRRKTCADADHIELNAACEASDLGRLARATARHPRMVAITEAHDTSAQKAYADAGFYVLSLNGNRGQDLPGVVATVEKVVRQQCPKRLILVTDDCSFGGLAQQAAQCNTEVFVWWSGVLPPVFKRSDYIVRDLEEDVLGRPRRRSVAAYMDYENIHIGLEHQQCFPSPQAILNAVSAEVADLGQIGDIHAYADWKRLSDSARCDVQRKLAERNVKTHYQINGFDKNCADMAIVEDVHTALDLCAAGARSIDAFVLVTGDRDFAEIVRRMQLSGKRVRVLTLRNSLSNGLKKVAADVRYLDERLCATQPIPAA